MSYNKQKYNMINSFIKKLKNLKDLNELDTCLGVVFYQMKTEVEFNNLGTSFVQFVQDGKIIKHNVIKFSKTEVAVFTFMTTNYFQDGFALVYEPFENGMQTDLKIYDTSKSVVVK